MTSVRGASGGAEGGDGEQPARKTRLTNEAFVGRLFRLLLKRGASPPEIEFQTDRMTSGRTRVEIVADFVASDEFSRRHRPGPTAGASWGDASVLHSIVAAAVAGAEEFGPETHRRTRRGAKWIVLSHCQTLGLANCLAQQNPGVDVSACDIWTFRRDPEAWKARIGACDHLFVNADLLARKECDFSTIDHVTPVPALWFGGYHPDSCYVNHKGVQVQTYMEVLNSVIAFAAFKKGLSVAEAVKRFNGRTYEAGRYYELWGAERDIVLSRWSGIGYDLRSAFRRWALRGAFMHTFEHPHIACLYDVARIATEKAGFEPVVGDAQMHPHDNLKQGPVYPVYPEVGAAHGSSGSYWFKAGGYGVISLEDFVANSYASYQEFDSESLAVDSHFSRRYSLVFDAI